jgi:GntR family transcriptional regulator, vanillate catabolism transcriptional regulator
MALAADTERASQTVKALLALRHMIIAGGLAPGERISELSLVDRLGVSRTPVRHALVRLEEEGFLDALPSGGFAVKAFTARDVFDAIETRGVLEGLAARLAAERGTPAADLAVLREILAEIDTLIQPNEIAADALSEYVGLNAQFHTLLSGLCGSKPLMRQIERAAALPFASPSGFVLAQSVMSRPQRLLIIAQDHHHAIIEAIELREGERAEAVTREHARLAARNLRHALKTQSAMDLVLGHALIRPTERASLP